MTTLITIKTEKKTTQQTFNNVIETSVFYNSIIILWKEINQDILHRVELDCKDADVVEIRKYN